MRSPFSESPSQAAGGSIRTGPTANEINHRSVASIEYHGGAGARRVAYLSAEFLLGPHLANNLLNLGITEAAREAMSGLGYDLDEILRRKKNPVSAMAAWADWRRVTWTPSRRLKCPRSRRSTVVMG
jgi:hypothetical protein